MLQPPHNTVFYSIVSATYTTDFGTNTVDAMDYFQLNSRELGGISLRQSLTNDVNRPTQYRVRVHLL